MKHRTILHKRILRERKASPFGPVRKPNSKDYRMVEFQTDALLSQDGLYRTARIIAEKIRSQEPEFGATGIRDLEDGSKVIYTLPIHKHRTQVFVDELGELEGVMNTKTLELPVEFKAILDYRS
tara:strand:- start:42422 stop:42793 length:372 start_codon:yes stop_codon:yes gene_type:complete